MYLEEQIQNVNPEDGKKKKTIDRQKYVKSLWKQLDKELRPTELVRKMAKIIFNEDDFDEVENEDDSCAGSEMSTNENDNIDEDEELADSECGNKTDDENENSNDDNDEEFVNDYTEGLSIPTLILCYIFILFYLKKNSFRCWIGL